MRVAQAYRFELDPNDVTAGALASHVGADRFAFNWGLALVKARLSERARVMELTLVEGLSAREAAALANTVAVPWTLASLRKEWNRAKAAGAPWWAENSKEAYSSGLDRLARALQAFSDSRSGRRKGRTVGFPRFRKRGDRASVAFTTGAIAVVDEHHVRLPRLGVIRTKERTRLGAQLARQHKGSRRRAGTKARIARCHAKVSDLRADGLHKLTTRLATTYGTVVVEDLNVAGMTRRPKPVVDPDRPGGYLANRAAAKAGLNRAVLDAAVAELRRQLAYKCAWYGSRLVTAGRFYPSSKTCSACGTPNAKLSLATRTFDCERCGVVIDRDLNAAVNLAALAAGISTVAGSGPETRNARTGMVPPREAGTGQPGKTGTASVEEAPASVLVGCDR